MNEKEEEEERNKMSKGSRGRKKENSKGIWKGVKKVKSEKVAKEKKKIMECIPICDSSIGHCPIRSHCHRVLRKGVRWKQKSDEKK